MRLPVGSVALALLLAGCFKSAEPLITPATADYPLPASATLDQLKPDARGGWQDEHRGLPIVREPAGWYLLTTDEGEKVRFLLKRIAPETYLAQDDQNEYGVVELRGSLWIDYAVGAPEVCTSLTAAALARYKVERDDGDCRLHDVAAAGQLFLSLLDGRIKPAYAFRVHQ